MNTSGATVRQYGREDINYESWYSPWMKRLASSKTRAELLGLLGEQTEAAERAAHAHLRAIEATHSMTSQSARRAHARNTVAAAGDYRIALRGALEIHDLFPEHARANSAAEREGDLRASERAKLAVAEALINELN